jgi:hypothetical protein
MGFAIASRLLAVLLAVMVFIGFSRSYYLRSWLDRPR